MKEEIKLSENLKRLAKKKNISITSLAKVASMNTSTLHNYFYGVRPRNILSLIRIANYFEVSLDELLLGQVSQKINPSKTEQRTLALSSNYELVISIRENCNE